MTAISTAVDAAEANETQAGFVSIPLNKLANSGRNIRRTDRKADLEALAASIKSLGLLQNLSVTGSEGDRFTVVAGGRRSAAPKCPRQTRRHGAGSSCPADSDDFGMRFRYWFGIGFRNDLGAPFRYHFGMGFRYHFGAPRLSPCGG